MDLGWGGPIRKGGLPSRAWHPARSLGHEADAMVREWGVRLSQVQGAQQSQV